MKEKMCTFLLCSVILFLNKPGDVRITISTLAIIIIFKANRNLGVVTKQRCAINY